MSASRLLLIAGPCVIEDEGLTVEIATRLAEMTAGLPVDLVFKASFDKANRTSLASYRGPGIDRGLEALDKVKSATGLPVLSDIHESWQAAPAAAVLDYLQIPAFLCRQTDLLLAAAETGKAVNIKKAQFLAPEDMRYPLEKAASTGNDRLLVTERGAAMGYHNLVVDFRSFSVLADFGYPVVFDATHSVQTPSKGGVTAGHRDYVRPLARAAAAYGIDGLFCEVHPQPDQAKSDAANSLRLDDAPALLKEVLAVRAAGDASDSRSPAAHG
jgi:2-dehydro-3-deoxyphosphooctonate aldolase (KDO 8-P synthase)